MMSKLSSMTIGLVLIFLGIQLTMVKSYLLTPTATGMIQEDIDALNRGGAMAAKEESMFSGIFGSAPSASSPPASSGQSWPYYQSGNTNTGSGSFQNSSWGGGSSDGKWIGPGKRMAPPRWVKWPPLFLGLVFFLHGLALRR